MAELFDGAMDLADAVMELGHLKDFMDKGVLKQQEAVFVSIPVIGRMSVLGKRENKTYLDLEPHHGHDFGNQTHVEGLVRIVVLFRNQ